MMNLAFKVKNPEPFLKIYGSLNKGGQLAIENWILMRNLNLEECRIFTLKEAFSLVLAFKDEKKLDFKTYFLPETAAKLIKLSIIQQNISQTIGISIGRLEAKLKSLTSTQMFFLTEFCWIYWYAKRVEIKERYNTEKIKNYILPIVKE